jgi:hypothetical protein
MSHWKPNFSKGDYQFNEFYWQLSIANDNDYRNSSIPPGAKVLMGKRLWLASACLLRPGL